MNRINFIGQTHQGTLVSIDDIINFFDHTMAAYQLVEDLDDARINGVTNNINSSLTLQIQSNDISSLQDIVTYINNNLHNRENCYGKSFAIDANINGSNVELFVQELTPTLY